MQPDASGHPGADVEAERFLRQIARPLGYLRDLGARMPEVLSAVAEPAESPDALPTRPKDSGPTEKLTPSDASVVQRLKEAFGFAPVLDLAAVDQRVAEVRLAAERYTVEGELGSGGMGQVLLVFDQDIRRRVAMKLLHEDVKDSKSVSRFLEEAQATGQLEHPNIAPVYDLGIDAAGRVFFTMKLVRGRNLKEIIRDLAIGRLDTARHFSPTRLVQILQQASMGVHYAHVRGVVHRDLKPDNVMVGDFGEVLVMDWGLAKIAGRSSEEGGGEVVVGAQLEERGAHTLDGTIQGTLAYMSPEQARGWVDEVDERTDVFGLGAILYEILTYHSPYEGRTMAEVLDKARVGEIVPPRQRAPRNHIPESLELICRKALAVHKDERYPEAKAFHEALQVFLDGRAEAQRRAQEAAALVRQGKVQAHEYRRLAEVERKLRREASDEVAKYAPHDTAARKQAAWSLEDEASRVRRRRIEVFNEATSFLHSAINVDEAQGAAKEALASLYWDRFCEAETLGIDDEMLIYRSLVERYDQGRFAQVLEGSGLLQLQSDPPGAEVTVHRLEESGRRLVEAGGSLAGRTPLRLELPMGYHLLVLRLPGCRETRYPVFVERSARLTAKVNLYRDDEIGKGFVYVPAGEVRLGGDPVAPGALGGARRYVSDVFVAENPVTFEEYCRFLDALRAERDPELDALLPHTEKEGVCVSLTPDGRFRPAVEKLVELPARRRYTEGFEWRLPVLAVSWFAAVTYCEWMSRRANRDVRLLRDSEWEKAARGPAHVFHPWGSSFDWSFTKGGLSRPEPAQPEPVGAFESDVSVYGIRDLAGTIREWCADWSVEGSARLIRGGAWSSMNAVSFRSAVRSGAQPAMKSSAVGFRVAVTPLRRAGAASVTGLSDG